MKELKEKRITIRLSPEEYDAICEKAAKAYMTPSAFIRASALRQKIVVIPDLRAVGREVKAIGSNINQLTMLAHQGRITAPRLDDTVDALIKVYEALADVAAMEKR